MSGLFANCLTKGLKASTRMVSHSALKPTQSRNIYYLNSIKVDSICPHYRYISPLERFAIQAFVWVGALSPMAYCLYQAKFWNGMASKDADGNVVWNFRTMISKKDGKLYNLKEFEEWEEVDG